MVLKINSKAAPRWQKIRLAKWLIEWNLEQTLKKNKRPNTKKGKASSTRDDHIDTSSLIKPYDKTIKVGQIRMLSPRILPDSPRPGYIAVISDWAPSIKLVASYSPFAEPATRGELLTGRQAPALRVLCLWNTRTVSDSLIEQSWLVDELSKSELQDAVAVFKHSATGADLPAHLIKRVGPPITHPKDPRIQYQQEQVELMSHLQTVTQKRSSPVITIPWFKEYTERSAQLLAAKGKVSSLFFDSYYAVIGKNLRMHAYLMPNEDRCAFVILTKDDNPSKELDDAVVVSVEKGVVSLPIKDGLTTLPMRDLKQGFFLHLSAGTPVIIKLKKIE